LAIEAGAKAPDFSLSGIDGERYSLAEALALGPVLLMFFKTTCATCDIACPYVRRLAEAYPNGGWTLWGVSQHPGEESSAYAAKYEIEYPVLLDERDEGYPVSMAYDPPSTPTFYLIDADGQVVEQSAGFDKGELNRISLRLAERLGVEAAVIAYAEDGNPDSRPGCVPRHQLPRR
jgi:peroxiredoxin